MWIGGSVGRVAGTGILSGLILIIYGMAPGALVAELLLHPPAWLLNPWLKVSFLAIGVVIIGASLHFNVWSFRQAAIDDLADDLSWAIHNLLNKAVASKKEVESWEESYRSWCDRVSLKLENRAFFTKADQLHFDRLGLVPLANYQGSYDDRHEWLVSQLNLKFERLRDIINWTQMRRR